MKAVILFLSLAAGILWSGCLFAQIPENNPNCMPGDGITVTLGDNSHVYLGGYGADRPLQRIPYVAKVDTSGNILWKKKYSRNHMGSVVTMLIKDSALYVVSKYDSVPLPITYNIFEVSKLNINNGDMIWKRDIYLKSTYYNGYYYTNTVKSIIFKNDTSLSVLAHRIGGNQININIVTLEIHTGNILLDFANINRYKFEDIAIDSSENIYGIGKDTVYCLLGSNADSIIWKTGINYSSYINRPGKIFITGSHVYAITSNYDGFGRVVKLSKDSGSILWNTHGNSSSGKIGSYCIKGNELFMAWNPTTVGGGSYPLMAEKVDLSTGTVCWLKSHPLPNSSGNGYTYNISAWDSTVTLTGYGLEQIYYSYREDYWAIVHLNSNNGQEKFCKKILLDPSRNEIFSCGKGVHYFNDKLYCFGNMQAAVQPTVPSSVIEYPMTNIGLIELDTLGYEINRKIISYGTQNINPPVISDTTICFSDTISLTSNNLPEWSHAWSLDGMPYSNAPDTSAFISTPSIIGITINNGLCNFTRNWDITINEVDTSVIASTNYLTANATGATYQWLICDSVFTAIPGEIYQSYLATTPGSYAVEVTQNGCIDTSFCQLVIAVNVIENSFFGLINVFPNPTTGNINLDLGKYFENIHVEIISVTGTVINCNTYYNTKVLNIDIPGAKGMYFITVNTPSGESAKLKIHKE
jgi:hypothetical protein